MITSVEVQGVGWSRLYQTWVSNNVRYVIAVAKKHPIISLGLLFGGGLFVYNKIIKRFNQVSDDR